MNITSYADLLKAAHMQSDAQRLLFVFAAAELPGEHTAEQKERFQSRAGGALTPIMCVDKLPEEVSRFAGLVEESKQIGKHWDIVFVGSMSGQAGMPPSSKDADMPLQLMIESIKSGNLKNYLTFNRDGELVQLR